MSVIGYFEAFPHKLQTDLRQATFPEGIGEIPAGAFLFMEYYCRDLTCNCQRVIIKVLHPKSTMDQSPCEVATFSYTWSDHLDEVWQQTNAELPNPFLDPCHHQEPYAPELLEFWTDMVARDKVYVERLKKHYRELREQLGESKRPAAFFDFSDFDMPMNREERRRLRKSLSGKTVRQ